MKTAYGSAHTGRLLATKAEQRKYRAIPTQRKLVKGKVETRQERHNHENEVRSARDIAEEQKNEQLLLRKGLNKEKVLRIVVAWADLIAFEEETAVQLVAQFDFKHYQRFR